MPIGIYKRSKEVRRKMSIAHTGKKNPKSSQTKLGHSVSIEARKRISNNLKRYYINHPEYREKLIEQLTGRIKSKETRRKLSIAGKKRAAKGNYHSKESIRKIKEARSKQVFSDEARLKMSLAQRGEKSWKWKGGMSSELQERLRSFEWIKTRRMVCKRDNQTCRICGYKAGGKLKLHVHHIVPYRISHDDSLENLITLCQTCHTKEEYKYYKSLKRKELVYVERSIIKNLD